MAKGRNNVDTLNKLVRQQFSEYHISPLSGGGTNAVYVLERRGSRSVLKVAMVSNRNASVERECLRILEESRTVPRLFQNFILAERIGLHMEFISGKTLLEHIQENLEAANNGAIYDIFSSLGRLLAEIHSANIADCSQLRKIELEEPPSKPFIDNRLNKRSIELFSELSGTFGRRASLLHGDFGYHNVIRDTSGNNRLIDWELAGIGDPRTDMANVLFWTHLHFPDIAHECGRRFVEAYLERREEECNPEIMHRFVIFQVWRIIEMVTDDFPAPVKSEWNRRLAWAIDHVFY